LKLKSALLPLALVWLAVHAVLLAAILGLKFLTAKTLLLLAMAGTLAWVVLGRRQRLALPPPPGMV
jgi:hypothetical protein